MVAHTPSFRVHFWRFVLSACLCFPALAIAAERKPNVLIFYLDDMSWAQPGCYGGKLAPTPHMDALARSGVRFTNGYSSACVCSPGRVGLMTGRYQSRTGHDSNTTGPGTELALSESTIAQRFKQSGYKTALLGKWHLGHTTEAHLPQCRGFDFSVGSLGNISARALADKTKLGEPYFFRGTQTLHTLSGAPVTSPVYASDACAFMEQNRDSPWFLLMSFNAVHDPLVASPELVARFSHLPKHEQYYAAMLAEADAAMGQVLKKLREQNQEENTLIFVLSDNGNGSGVAETGGLRGRKWFLWEGGIRVSWIASWKGRFPAGRVLQDPVIQLDILPTALAAAGTPVDPEWQLDGVSLLPLLEGRRQELEPRALYFRFGVQRAVRAGDWKLVKASAAMEPMLVNLAEDPAETTDLSTREPLKRAELEKLFEAWNATMQPPRWQDGRWNGVEQSAQSPGSSGQPPKPSPRPVAERSPEASALRKMPRVLLIGDSICSGYEKEVRALLEGKAKVVKNAGNAEYTGNGVKQIDAWLGEDRWDVIHFNWGLWDMYGWRHHAVDRSPAKYEQRMEILVARLKKTGAKLIWATTTPPCPAPEKTMRERFQREVQIAPELQKEYAEAALRVMRKHGVTINDLHALMLPDLSQYLIAEDNVHYTKAGSRRQAEQVAQKILEALEAF